MRILLFILFSLNLYAHPLNITKMTLDMNKSIPTLTMRFAIFNIYKAFHNDKFNETKTKNYILKHIKIDGCKIIFDKMEIHNLMVVDSWYHLKCNKINSIKFNLFFDFDKTQQGIIKYITPKKEDVLIFSPQNEIYKFKHKNIFLEFLKVGIFHILEGIDHQFFLLMLIVGVLLNNYGFKVSLIEILKVVTAFTLSHSITLSLSMFHIINPPENLIEVLIAMTILFVALNNIYRWVLNEWYLAFIFGFIHGFGFANALKELKLDTTNFIQVVLGFNSGVEVGQILIVSILFPLLYISNIKIKRGLIYLTILLSSLWIIDRSFSLHFMPF